jgi:hypothetical protein
MILAVLGVAACSGAAGPDPAGAADSTATAGDSANPPPSAPATRTFSPPPSLSAAVRITPIPGAPDSGTTVRLVAEHVRWSPTTLAAPAGATWHIVVDNRDGPPEHHNFVVASGRTVAERIYQSPNFDKGSVSFVVPALPAGTYLFVCTVHADVMTGTLTIG